MYKVDGKQVFSEKNGKLVATIGDGGALVFATGMAAQHKNKLTAFLKDKAVVVNSVSAVGETTPETPPPSQGMTVPALVGEKDNSMPPFDKRMGFRTVGFAEWAEGRSKEEVARKVSILEKI
jgi:hypothetical protein